jgi:hypothetical protein
MNKESRAEHELLAYLFLREIGSIIASRNTYTEVQDALADYLAEVRLYGKRTDFKTMTRFPDKNILSLLMQPQTLEDSFRAWLRKQGINPDQLLSGDQLRSKKK